MVLDVVELNAVELNAVELNAVKFSMLYMVSTRLSLRVFVFDFVN